MHPKGSYEGDEAEEPEGPPWMEKLAVHHELSAECEKENHKVPGAANEPKYDINGYLRTV